MGKTALENQFFHYSTMMSMQLKGLVATAVYRKALKLSPAARQKSTVVSGGGGGSSSSS